MDPAPPLGTEPADRAGTGYAKTRASSLALAERLLSQRFELVSGVLDNQLILVDLLRRGRVFRTNRDQDVVLSGVELTTDVVEGDSRTISYKTSLHFNAFRVYIWEGHRQQLCKTVGFAGRWSA